MAQSPNGIPPRRTEEQEYERDIKNVILIPLFARMYAGLEDAQHALTLLQINPEYFADRSREFYYRIESVANDHVDRVNRYHRSRFQQTFKAALGIDVTPYLDLQNVKTYMANAIRDNVALIKTIPPSAHAGLADRLRKQLQQNAFDQVSITEMLEKQYKVSGGRARVLSRDQTSKTIGKLNEQRQRSVGIKRYMWNATLDRRTRPSHAALHGTIHSWGVRPYVGGKDGYGHPGEPIMCRCVAIAVTEDMGQAVPVELGIIPGRINPIIPGIPGRPGHSPGLGPYRPRPDPRDFSPVFFLLWLLTLPPGQPPGTVPPSVLLLPPVPEPVLLLEPVPSPVPVPLPGTVPPVPIRPVEPGVIGPGGAVPAPLPPGAAPAIPFVEPGVVTTPGAGAVLGEGVPPPDGYHWCPLDREVKGGVIGPGGAVPAPYPEASEGTCLYLDDKNGRCMQLHLNRIFMGSDKCIEQERGVVELGVIGPCGAVPAPYGADESPENMASKMLMGLKDDHVRTTKKLTSFRATPSNVDLSVGDLLPLIMPMSTTNSGYIALHHAVPQTRENKEDAALTCFEMDISVGTRAVITNSELQEIILMPGNSLRVRERRDDIHVPVQVSAGEYEEVAFDRYYVLGTESPDDDPVVSRVWERTLVSEVVEIGPPPTDIPIERPCFDIYGFARFATLQPMVLEERVHEVWRQRASVLNFAYYAWIVSKKSVLLPPGFNPPEGVSLPAGSAGVPLPSAPSPSEPPIREKFYQPT